MPKLLITTVPFGENNKFPFELLENAEIEYLLNPLNKKLTEDELVEKATDFDVFSRYRVNNKKGNRQFS